MPLLNSRQTNALRKLRLWVASWERAANYPGVRKTTWDQLVELGYVEQRREGTLASSGLRRRVSAWWTKLISDKALGTIATAAR